MSGKVPVPCLLVLITILSTIAISGGSPAPTLGAAVKIVPVGQHRADNVSVQNAAVIDESRLAIVGTVSNPNADAPHNFAPNGAIVDMTLASSKAFTNGHDTQIRHIAVGRGRIVTTADGRDEFLRIWNLNREVQDEPIRIEPQNNDPNATANDYGIALFPNSDRVAVRVDEQIHVIDFAAPNKRRTYDYPEKLLQYLGGPVVVSHDERTITCCTFPIHELVCWEVKSRKRVQFPIPLQGEKSAEWQRANPHGRQTESFLKPLQFLSNSSVFLLRSHMQLIDQKFPDTLDESKIDPAQRSTLTVGLPKGQIDHLGMGRSDLTFYAALDPTQTWLALVGSAPAENAKADQPRRGELRVYDFKARKLVHRELTAEADPLTWVGFTPSGKRLVAASAVGLVRWWDIGPVKAP